MIAFNGIPTELVSFSRTTFSMKWSTSEFRLPSPFPEGPFSKFILVSLYHLSRIIIMMVFLLLSYLFEIVY